MVEELRDIAKAGLLIDSFANRLQLLGKLKVLGSLPAVQAAGSDARARFEYLAQAVSDAIDGLSQPSDEPAEHSDGHRETLALRHLFGLTNHTRRATWRVKQDAAGSTLHVSWDYFRHRIQNMLLHAAAERLLSNRSMAINGADDFPPAFGAYAPQANVESATVAYIHRSRPQHAKLLELSTATTLPILRALREVGSTIRLLIADPSVAHSTQFMNERLRRAQADLTDEFTGDASTDIRAYAVSPSLRGRIIGAPRS